MSALTRGILLMMLGSALLTANDALSKWLTESYPVTQVWCLRAVSAMLLIAALAPPFGGLRCLRPRRIGGQTLRAALFVATTLLIVWSLSAMPLVDVSAIVFASPLFVAVLSPLVLGESVHRHQVAGALLGFAGVALILKPGAGVLEAGALLAVAAALSSALRDVVTRRIGRHEHPMAILFFSNAAVLVVGACIAFAPSTRWPAVSASDWGLVVANGFLNAAAHLAIIESLRVAEAASVAPYKYTGLLWSVLFGALLFAELPGPLTTGGALLVVVSGLYIAHCERHAARPDASS